MSDLQNRIKSGRKLEISFESFVIFSLISVLAVPLAMAKTLNWSNLIDFIYIGITITVVIACLTFLSLYVMRNFLRNLSHRYHFIAMLVIITSIGATRGVLLFYAFELGGFQQPTELHLRIITSTASTVFWLLAISLAIQDTHNYQRKYSNILKSSILRLAREDANSHSSTWKMPLSDELQQIESTLNKTFDETIRSVERRDSLLRAALIVRETVDELVRPLSHRLWVDHFDQAPKVKLWATILESIRFLKIQPQPIASFLTLISVFNLTSDYGALRGLIGATTVFLVSYISIKFLTQYFLNTSQGKFLFNFFYLLLPGTILSTVIYFTNDFLYHNDTGLLAYSYVGLVFIVAVLYSTRELTMSDRWNLLINLQNDLGTVTFSTSEPTVRSNAEVASFLHNSLQSELLALSYQLEDVANNPDPIKTKELLEQLGSRINRSISQDFDDFIEDPFSRLQKLTLAWRGIVAISLINDDFAHLKPKKAHLVVQIIEEAISNAVRHAKAQSVSISINPLSNENVQIVIINDGQARTKGKGGLGAEWLEKYAAGKWSRELKDGQIKLELVL